MCGADGNTLGVMKKALHIKSDEDLKKWRESTLRQYVNNLLSKVNNNKEIISIGNRIFLENTARVEQDYQKFVEDVFGVSVCLCNFEQDPQTERKKINDWVEENQQTYQRFVTF